MNSETFNAKIENLSKNIDDLAKRMRSALPHPGPSLYFVSLENDRMLLHFSDKKSDEIILEECSHLYEFARIHKPLTLAFELKSVDIHEVDALVKKFMFMFGIDNTRGGSYIDVELHDYQTKSLEKEFEFIRENTRETI